MEAKMDPSRQKRTKLGSYTSSSSGESCDSLGQTSGSVTSLSVASLSGRLSPSNRTPGLAGMLVGSGGGCVSSTSATVLSSSTNVTMGRTTNAAALSAATAATAPFNFQPLLPIQLSPKPRKYSLNQQQFTSGASQAASHHHQAQHRKSSLQPPSSSGQAGSGNHSPSGLPNLMHLLLGSCRDVNNNPMPPPSSSSTASSSNAHLQPSDNLPNDPSEIDRSPTLSNVAIPSTPAPPCELYVPGRKKYSEPYLPGLLREELFGRLTHSNATSAGASNGAPISLTLAGLPVANGSGPTPPTLPASHLLSLLPFRRFSKRAQSDPWIVDKLLCSPCASRRFTLGTENFTFSNEVRHILTSFLKFSYFSYSFPRALYNFNFFFRSSTPSFRHTSDMIAAEFRFPYVYKTQSEAYAFSFRPWFLRYFVIFSVSSDFHLLVTFRTSSFTSKGDASFYTSASHCIYWPLYVFSCPYKIASLQCTQRFVCAHFFPFSRTRPESTRSKHRHTRISSSKRNRENEKTLDQF